MNAEHPKPDSTQLAAKRTFLAAERTLFAGLRTGLSIAGGGSLVITLLGDDWPYWVQLPLVATFLLVGYGITYSGLRQYRSVLTELGRHHPDHVPLAPVRTMIIALGALQLAILVVVVLFLVAAFEGGA